MENVQTECRPVADENETIETLRRIIVSYEKKESNLIQILHMAQALYGYLPDSVLRVIVSFYSYFSTQPKGRHTIQVCLGTACYVRGGTRVLEALKNSLKIDVAQTTGDGRFSLEVKRCIGSCGLAPAIRIDQTVHKRVNPTRIDEILDLYR
jgi:NADH:ubiquinone oxidoreductase subunit E